MHKRLTERQRGMWSSLVLALALPTLPMSLSLLALTAYIRFVVDEELELVQGMNTAGVPYFLAVTGTLNFLSNLLLVSAMARAHRPSVREPSLQALFIAVGLDLGATLLVFIACIVCFVQMAVLPDSFRDGLWQAMREYSRDPHVKVRVDLLQMEYACCGDSGYRDWFLVPWVPEDILLVDPKELQIHLGKDSEYVNDDVPFSCCDSASPRPCIHHHVATDHLHYMYDHRLNTTLYSAGCRQSLMEYFGHTLLRNVALGLLALVMLQLSIVTVARLLQTSMQSAIYEGDIRAPAIGYLFGPPRAHGTKTDPEEGEDAESEALLPSGADKPADTTDTEEEATTDEPGSGVSSPRGGEGRGPPYPISTDLDTTPITDDEPLYENIPAESLYENIPAESLYENIPAESLYENIPAESLHQNIPAESLHQNIPAEPLYDDIGSWTTPEQQDGSQQQQNSGGHPTQGAVPLFPSEMGPGGSSQNVNVNYMVNGARYRIGSSSSSKAFGSLGIPAPHLPRHHHHHPPHHAHHHPPPPPPHHSHHPPHHSSHPPSQPPPHHHLPHHSSGVPHYRPSHRTQHC